ncbi:hypothetical protein [Shouchella miscanthi]|uniref:hypothetical protein n=1 Tax=Shouchella miscanthi TaxID=2598861 RepID=UPI0011AAD9A6|nr:hypothetical protein [Shouchella miscanthi]
MKKLLFAVVILLSIGFTSEAQASTSNVASPGNTVSAQDVSIQGSRIVSNIQRTFSSYPPQTIYYSSGGYGGHIQLQMVRRSGSNYIGIYAGEIRPICVGGVCP